MKKFLLFAVAILAVATVSAETVSKKSANSMSAAVAGPAIETSVVQVSPTVDEPILLPESMIKSHKTVVSNIPAGEALDLTGATFELANPMTATRSNIKDYELWTSYYGSGTDYASNSNTTWTMYPTTATTSSGSTVDVLVDVIPNLWTSSGIENIPVEYSISGSTLTIPAVHVLTATGSSYTYYIYLFSGESSDGSIVMTVGSDGSLTVDEDDMLVYGAFTSNALDLTYSTYAGYYEIVQDVVYLEPGTLVTPEPAFEPQGLYLNAFVNDAGYSYTYPHSMMPAYADNTFKNYTTSTVTGYEWTTSLLEYSSSTSAYEATTTYTGTDKDFVLSTESGIYGATTVTAINETLSADYTYGWGNYNYTTDNNRGDLLVYAGAMSSNWTMTSGSCPIVGKATYDYGWVTYTNFGTKDLYTNSTYGDVMTHIIYQGIPDAPMYIEGVTFLVKSFSVLSSDGIDLTCQLYKITRSSSGAITFGDLIAESTTASYVTNSNTTLTFTDFYTYDEDGMTVGVDHLFIEDEFAVLLDGWNNGSVSGYLMSEYYNDSSTLPSYYFYGSTYGTDRYIYYTFTNHIVQGFDVTYGFLYTESSTDFTFDADGGSQTISIYPYLCSVDSSTSAYTTRLFLEDDSEIPDWLEVGYSNESYTDDSWGFDLVLTAEALPSGTDERSGSFRLYQEGSYLDITVTQTESGGISSTVVDSSNASAYVDGDNIVISGAEGAELYSVAGQKVGEGETSIDASALSSGVYIVKLSDGTAVKVVK